MNLKSGTLVWLSKSEYELNLRNVGTVVSLIEDSYVKENTYYVQCGNMWYLRTIHQLKSLTDAEKVLYMLESGEQCK